MPTTALTGKYGLGKASVLRLLHEAGAEMRRQPFSDQEVDDAVRLYASGLRVAAVGSRLGVPPSKVWRALRARGVVLRPPRNRPPAPRRSCADKLELSSRLLGPPVMAAVRSQRRAATPVQVSSHDEGCSSSDSCHSIRWRMRIRVGRPLTIEGG